jgi:hypothetical protein
MPNQNLQARIPVECSAEDDPNKMALCAVRERVSKHRVSALGLFLGSLVLNDIPVLDQDSVFHADNIRGDPVDRQPEARESAVDDDKVSVRYDYSRLIPERRRDALALDNFGYFPCWQCSWKFLVLVPKFIRVFLGESASVLGLRPIIVGRLSKTSSVFILSDFWAGYTDSPQPGLLTNLFRRGAA